MKWTGLNDLREMYLSFFEGKGHTRLSSFSLVPQGDKSLLLINSGMAPLKKYFLGQATPPNTRVTTCQKCIRTPDIERVGKTSRHGTYFEMLGNFSFGDYFKDEATAWAWEFITKVLELPKERLWISIYEEDDETFDVWTKKVGIPPERIVRLGKEDNFWEHGSGPCGPCSEIYFDRGVEHGCGSPDCKVGCDCDRFVEFWNLVFSQFDHDGNGHYERMAKPNIDTGMGLERLACIMQGVDNLFEVDTVQNIMKHISQIANVTYKENEKTDVSLRVITDHIRSTTFMIADGVSPSNEGRGYVLRRLLRRAARHGRLLNVNEPFLYKVVDTVAKENETAYPELIEKAEYIKKVVKNEEEAFNKTIGKGMEMLMQLIDKASADGVNTLSGAEAFKLYDTYGFPIDLTEEIVAEKGLIVDLEEFEKYMLEQRERARESHRAKAGSSWESETLELPDLVTVFTGYETVTENSKIEALLIEGKATDIATCDQEVIVMLNKTPFYTESGGQVSDKGILKGANGIISVKDMKKLPSGQVIHIGYVKEGTIQNGEQVIAEVDKNRRKSIMRNHTAAHLLQASLRNVLGDHVHQAGQLVNKDAVRFDFTHFEPVSPAQIKAIEAEINEKIMECIPVLNYETDINTAKEKGAMALFSEKYGETVRVVEVSDYSVELCGGTHVKNTGELGLFRIISESSVAAGVRRIEAVTGLGFVKLAEDYQNSLLELANTLKTTPAELPNRCEALISEIKEKDREISILNSKLASGQLEELLKDVKDVNGVSVITANVGSIGVDALRTLGDKIKERDSMACALLCSGQNFLCVVGDGAVKKGVHAGKIVKEVAQKTGGKGGGRPDSAMAGVGDASLIAEAMDIVEDLVKAQIK